MTIENAERPLDLSQRAIPAAHRARWSGNAAVITVKHRPFALTTPCVDCPFRTNIRPYLRKGRIDMLEKDLRDKTFSCHKTVDYDAEEDARWDDDEGATVVRSTSSTSHCAGALILLEKMRRPSQMMRIAARLGIYDRSKLDMSAPVFATFAAMREAQNS